MRVGKPAEGEPCRPPPLFPLSLSYPLPNPNLVDEGCPRQLCDVSLLHHVSVGFISAYLTRHVLSWCVHWANQKSKLFKKLISYPIRFITSRIHLMKWKRGKAAPWQHLPLDVGKELGKRLVSRLDVLRFRSVCKNWRLSLPTPTLFPLRVPPPPDSDPNSAYFITELNILYNPMLDLYSRHIAVEELDHGGRFRRPMGLGFPCELHFNCPRGVLFMGGRKHRLSRMPFVGKVYFVRCGSIRSDHSVQLDSRYNPVRRMVVISGSNVISSNAEGVNPSYVRASDLSVVALFEGGEMDGRLAVLRLGGGGGDNWNWDTGVCSHVFADIGSYKGKLSAIDHSGRVFLMDYHSLEMTQFAPSPSNVAPGKHSKKLFEIGGDMYLGDSSGEFFYFYKLDLQRRVWIGDGFAAQHIPKLEALGPAFRYWVENTGPSRPDLSWLAIPYMPRCYLLAFLSICARCMYAIYMCDPSLLACMCLNLIGFALIVIGS